MAIVLTQTNRTLTSVTFGVTGITDDRRTYIWIPWRVNPVDDTNWWILQDAESNGDVVGFYTSGGDNGSIQVIFSLANTAEYKVWDFCVTNVINGNDTAVSNLFHGIIMFEWDGTATKTAGNDVDITENDFIKLNWFALYIRYWIGGVDNSWEYYTDAIYADDLLEIAQKIYDTAYGLTTSKLANRSNILSYTGYILDYATSGGYIYATFFNNIKSAINSFNLST